MLRAGAVRRLPARYAPRMVLRLRAQSALRPARAKSIAPARVPQRFYAKARAPQALAEEEGSDLPEAPPKSEEEEKDKKQLVVPGPVPLSFWYTSDKEYIDENFMRVRDMYRISTFDLQEAVRLRVKEFELHLDEFKRRVRAPHLVEYMKHQQKAVAEFRPMLRAALKERRTAYKDYLLGIDRKIEKEAPVSQEELQRMVHSPSANSVKEMNDHIMKILTKFYEERFQRLGELAQDPIAEELVDQSPETLEREVFEDMLPSTPKEGSNVLDNMLMGDWFPDPKHLDSGADTYLRQWHSRKNFLRSHAKLNNYGLRTHPITEPVPGRDWHQKQTEVLNKRARIVAEKLAMPEYLRLPSIPKDATPEKREHLLKMQLLIHEARRTRLAIHRRELDKAEVQERMQELRAAIENPTGLTAFLVATPVENNYQLAALLIQLEQAQSLAVKGDIKSEDLVSFDEAVAILRRIVKDRNIPFTLLPPIIDPNDVTFLADEADPAAAGESAVKAAASPAQTETAAADAMKSTLAADLGEATPTPASATESAAAPASPAATVTSTPSPPEEPAVEAPEPTAPKAREPLPPLPRVSLQQKLSQEELDTLEQELRHLEAAELYVLPSANEYIDELRNMLDAYSGKELDYSFLDREYDVEISHRYGIMPEIPNQYGRKATQMHERRVRMLVKVDSLGLPQIVKERLIAIAGQRYDPATGKVIVTSDSKTSAFQNMRYVKKLLQRLIAEAYLAHPRYISMEDLTPPQPVTLGPKIQLPKALPLKFGIFRFRRPLFLDSDWEELKATAPIDVAQPV